MGPATNMKVRIWPLRKVAYMYIGNIVALSVDNVLGYTILTPSRNKSTMQRQLILICHLTVVELASKDYY